ncbi:MAG TPA: addiction module antidote protein, HigA family [Alphaproteobacteria bacterium]|nr:addiction module antidote protein, HigA family [Alphaproteobacteria bacterium]
MTERKLHNPHAGEILKYEFIDEIGISQNALAKAIKVPANRIHHIIKGVRRITADTDLRLCKFFAVSDGYFLRLQSIYETMEAKKELKNKIDSIPLYSVFLKTHGQYESRL